jgi:aminoglycoside phosphotransferase (APT) family kinase protein
VVIDDLARHAEGFSWETYTFTASWADRSGTRHVRGFALRREPVEGTLEHYDAARDYRIYEAVSRYSDVPVPAPYWLEADPSVLDRPFFVMERVEGDVPVPWRPNDPRIFPSDTARSELGREFVSVLARLHGIDVGASGLGFLGAPSSSETGARAAIADWERVYEQALTIEVPLLRYAFGWLRDNVCTSGKVTLVHGDFRIGNFMVDRDRHINAVFDWELAHLGDPIFDLAYSGLRLYRGRSPLLSRLLPADEYFELYTKLTGTPVAWDVFHFWTVFGYVRALTQYARACRAFDDRRANDLRLAAMAHQSLHLLKYLAEDLGLRQVNA